MSFEFSAHALEAIAAPPMVNDPQQRTELERLIAGCQTCFLQPYVFFVTWGGPLTLAYSGFPPALINLKAAIASVCRGLPPENAGSKWPKVICPRSGPPIRNSIAVYLSVPVCT